MQYEEVMESEDRPAPANVQEPLTTNNKKKRHPTGTPVPVAATEPAKPTRPAAPIAKREKPEKPTGGTGGEVVRLDRFRKK
jgi:hypothetical protein